MKQSRRRFSQPTCLMFLLFIFGTIALGVVAAMRKLEAIRHPFNELAFHSAAWQAANTFKEKGRRAKMVGDLLRHYVKPGMKAKEVTALLGMPETKQDDVRPYSGLRIQNASEMYQYDMGYAPMDIAGQHFLLHLYFDARGRYLGSSVDVD